MAALRFLVIIFLNCFGLFNIRSLLFPNRSSQKQIAFQAYSIHLAQFYQTIITELLKLPEKVSVRFIIVLHPHFPLRSALELRDFVRSQLLIPAAHIQFDWQTVWDKFDLTIATDVYARFPLRRLKKCLLAHGPGLQSRFFRRHLLRKSICNFDLICVNGNYDYALVDNFLKTKKYPPKLQAVGLPFLDRFNSLSTTKERYCKKLQLDHQKKTILFAPHWTSLGLIQERHHNNYFDEVLRLLETLPMNIVLKLHACSLNKILGGNVDWRLKLAQIASDTNVRLDEEVDDLPALKYADILITDISSRAFNFMALHKPVILYFPLRRAWDELDKKRLTLMQRGAFIAAKAAEIPEIVHNIEQQGLTSSNGDQVAKDCFSHFGNATEALVELIKRELQ